MDSLVDLAAQAAVYRCYAADGTLLYLGSSGDIWGRLRSHSGKAWALAIRGITLEWHPDLESAQAAERLAIMVESPRYNEQHLAAEVKDLRRPRLTSSTRGPKVREVMRAFLTTPMQVKDLRQALAKAGFAPARETVQRWLSQDIAAGLVVRDSFGRYRSRETA